MRKPRTNHPSAKSVNPHDHLGLVWSEAERAANMQRAYRGRINDIAQDYVGDMYISLDKACKKFNPTRGFAVSTYAVRAIRLNYIRDVLSKKENTEPLCDSEGIEYRGKQDSGLDAIDETEEYSCWHRIFYEELAKLDDRTQQVVKLRLGGMTLEEIGDKVTPNITKERARQLISAALTTPGFKSLFERRFGATNGRPVFPNGTDLSIVVRENKKRAWVCDVSGEWMSVEPGKAASVFGRKKKKESSDETTGR